MQRVPIVWELKITHGLLMPSIFPNGHWHVGIYGLRINYKKMPRTLYVYKWFLEII